MKINTHGSSFNPQNRKLVLLVSIIGGAFIYSLFGLCAFACFYYGKNISAGVFVLAILVIITILAIIILKDISKAYINITGDNILVVDYYFGVKKEKTFPFSDITSAEIISGYSHHVKGYRIAFGGLHYIVLKNNSEYLFKVICTPETKQLFRQYLEHSS